MAHELGKSLNEVMDWKGPDGKVAPTTYRQYLTWMEWLDMQWNLPSRSDYYAMATRLSVVRSNCQNPEDVKLEDMKIPFKSERKKVSTPETRAAHLRNVKWAWIGRVGGKVRDQYGREVTPDGPVNQGGV